MVSQTHCPICGFIMMMEILKDEVNYTCVNNHGESQ